MQRRKECTYDCLAGNIAFEGPEDCWGASFSILSWQEDPKLLVLEMAAAHSVV